MPKPFRHFASQWGLFLMTMVFMSCSPEEQWKTLETDAFTLEVPETWTLDGQTPGDPQMGFVHGKEVKLRFEYSPTGVATLLPPAPEEYLREQELWLPPCAFCEPRIIYTAPEHIEYARTQELEKHPNKPKEVRPYPEYDIEVREPTPGEAQTYPDAIRIAILSRPDSSLLVPIKLPGSANQFIFVVDTFDHCSRKMVFPKENGKGMPALFIQDLQSGANLMLQAEKVPASSEETLKKVFKTVKFSN